MKKSIKKILSMVILATMLLSSTIVASASETMVTPESEVNEAITQSPRLTLNATVRGDGIRHRSTMSTASSSNILGLMYNGEWVNRGRYINSSWVEVTRDNFQKGYSHPSYIRIGLHFLN